MRKLFLSLPVLLLAGPILAQSDCSDAAILAMKGSWKKHADANMRYDKNQARINHCLDSISKIFQSSLADLRGLDAAWYRTMSDPMVPGEPPGYNFASLYKAWYCNIHVHKILLSDETGTWINVNVNSIAGLLSNQHTESNLQVNGMSVYNLPVRRGTWQGYDLYYQQGQGTKANCILLTHRNLLPWRPVTQREYLMAWRAYTQKLKEGSTINMASMQAEDQKEIEHIQNNPNMKPEMKEAALRGIQKREAMYEGHANGDAKMSRAFDDKLKLIDDYLTHEPEATLSQPAWIPSKGMSGFDGSFSSEDRGGILQVVLNPDYFSRDMPSYIPQLILMQWTWDKNTPSLQFMKQFEDNFPIGKLAAMLDHTNK